MLFMLDCAVQFPAAMTCGLQRKATRLVSALLEMTVALHQQRLGCDWVEQYR